MRRTTNQDSDGFGSDSFLDVVANIVGILIILVMVAGVRVGKASLEAASRPPDRSAAARELERLKSQAVSVESELRSLAAQADSVRLAAAQGARERGALLVLASAAE